MSTKKLFNLSQSVANLYMSYIISLSEKYNISLDYTEISNLETEEDYFYYIDDVLKEFVYYAEKLYRKEKIYTRYLELRKEYDEIYINYKDFKERTWCK